MATPPRQRQWNVEPPPEADWFADALPDIQSFVSSVTYALTQQLSRGDNFRSQKKVLELDTTNTNNFPLDFDCTLGATPEEIRVAQVKILTQFGLMGTGGVSCANWELLEGNRIRLHGITGLAATTNYQITLIVE